MINSLQKNYILFLLLSLLICIPSLSKSSDTPEIKTYWSIPGNYSDNNHSNNFKKFLKNHFTYNIRTTQPSYKNSHTPHNQNNWHNPYIAYMSVSDFQYIFASIANKYDILNNYSLYAYPNFRSFARTLPCYNEFMLALQTKIETDKNFKVQTTHIPGFDISGFHNFVEHEAHSIRNNQTIASQKTTTEKKETLYVNNTQTLNELTHNCIQKINATHSNNNHERLHNRLVAIEQTRKQNGRCFSYIAQAPQLNSHDPDIKTFQNTYGTHLDCQLHKELCHTRNTMHQLERTHSHNPHVQILAPVVYRYTTQAKNEHCPLTAFELSDFCHTITQVLAHGMHILYDASSAIGKGVVKGAHDFTSIEHWKDMATGAVQLGLLFADAIGKEDALHYAMVLTATTNNSDALTVATEEYYSYTQAQKNAVKLCAQETYKKIKTMSWQEILEHGTEIGTTIILDTLALNAINGFSRTASNLVIKELNNALESGALLTEQYAIEVAGFGKLIVEEGAEISAKAANLIKNESMLFTKSTEAIAPQVKTKITQAKWSENIVQKIRNVADDILDVMEKAGGHTLEKHVAQTYDELMIRAAKGLKNATTFTNKRIATKAVKENLKHHTEKIALWLNDPLENQIILEFSHSYPLGKGVLKGKKAPFNNLTSSRIVLKKDVTHDFGFKIVTAFPIL